MCVRYATEHRCGVAVRGPGLSDAVGDTDPLKDKLPLKRAVPQDDSPEVCASSWWRVILQHVLSASSSTQRAVPLDGRQTEGCGGARDARQRGGGCTLCTASVVAPEAAILWVGPCYGTCSAPMLRAPWAEGWKPTAPQQEARRRATVTDRNKPLATCPPAAAVLPHARPPPLWAVATVQALSPTSPCASPSSGCPTPP